MRTSQATSIRKPLEQAIKAINDSFEREKNSQETAAEFEKEFERRAAMPEGVAPATKVKRRTKKKYEQDVQGGSRSVPNRPRIANYYPWRHCVAEAARHLADCDWTKEAEAIYRELKDLPKDSDPIDWSQPGALEEIRTAVFEGAYRIRDILMDCLREMDQVIRSSTKPKSKAKPSIKELYDSLSEDQHDELWIFVDFKKFQSKLKNKTMAFLQSRRDLTQYNQDSLKDLVDRIRKLEIVKGDKDLRKLSAFRSKVLKNSFADE